MRDEVELTYCVILKDYEDDDIYAVIHFKELVDPDEVKHTIQKVKNENEDYIMEDILEAIEEKFRVKMIISREAQDFEVLLV